jgi:hypothetical protein
MEYSKQYDAYYNPTTNEWTESKCDDPNCEYCMNRPDKPTETCLVCDKPAQYVRCTQFAGDHPYCEEHAKLESDFDENDSYTYWVKLD